MFCYSYSQGYNFSGYAEYAFLVAQDALLIAILLHYLNLLNVNSAALFGLFLAYELGLGFGKYPQWITMASINICIPISAGSKVLQLKTILDSKDSGQVNAMSWAIAAYTCIARIFTGLLVIGDKFILTNLTINLILNLAITFATIYYKNATSPGIKKSA